MGSGSLDNYGWIEIIFVAVVALGFGFWQLWSINREIAKDKAKARAAIQARRDQAGGETMVHGVDTIPAKGQRMNPDGDLGQSGGYQADSGGSDGGGSDGGGGGD